MRTYTSLEALAVGSRCKYAAMTQWGWIARRTAKAATHRLYYWLADGQVAGKVVAEELAAKEG